MLDWLIPIASGLLAMLAVAVIFMAFYVFYAPGISEMFDSVREELDE